MKKQRTRLFDISMLIFLAIGIGNTALNWALMLLLYNRLHFGYWPSSATGFLVTSALSFVLNRRFSFKSKGKLAADLARFAVVIAVCYLVAYSVAKPLIERVLQAEALRGVSHWSDQIALIVGNVIFTALNYFGQRFFAFRYKGRS